MCSLQVTVKQEQDKIAACYLVVMYASPVMLAQFGLVALLI
jgi:hypothetical protein